MDYKLFLNKVIFMLDYLMWVIIIKCLYIVVLGDDFRYVEKVLKGEDIKLFLIYVIIWYEIICYW